MKKPVSRTEARLVTENTEEKPSAEKMPAPLAPPPPIIPIVPVKGIKQMTYLEGEERVAVGPMEVVKGRLYGTSLIPFSGNVA